MPHPNEHAVAAAAAAAAAESKAHCCTCAIMYTELRSSAVGVGIALFNKRVLLATHKHA
jgi:hypothetical protein